MTDTELSRALHDLTPEPPRLLGDVIARAKSRQRRRLAAAFVVPTVLIAGLAVLVPHGHHVRSVITEPVPSASPSAASMSPVPAPTEPPITDMHATRRPLGPLTDGHGDVDGNGVPDRVIVSTSGAVTLELNRKYTLRATVPALGGRLQGIADLFGTPGRQVLVSVPGSGCCGYRPTASTTYVLTLHGQALTLVRTADGKPLTLSFSLGRGEVYSGIQCDPRKAQLTAISIVRESTQLSRESRFIDTLDGATAQVLVAPPYYFGTPDQRPVTQAQLKYAQGAHGCPGLAVDGFAAP